MFSLLRLDDVATSSELVFISVYFLFQILSYFILKQSSSLNVLICCASIVVGFLLGVDQEGVTGDNHCLVHILSGDMSLLMYILTCDM